MSLKNWVSCILKFLGCDPDILEDALIYQLAGLHGLLESILVEFLFQVVFTFEASFLPRVEDHALLIILLLLCHLFLSYRLNEITGWAQVPLSDQAEQILVHLRLIILLDEVQELRNIAHQKKFALFSIEFTLMELNL